MQVPAFLPATRLDHQSAQHQPSPVESAQEAVSQEQDLSVMPAEPEAAADQATASLNQPCLMQARLPLPLAWVAVWVSVAALVSAAALIESPQGKS